MTFADCLNACAANPEFVKNWARLRGIRFAGNPLERAIDTATGYDEHIAQTFIEDVADLLWSRLPEADS